MVTSLALVTRGEDIFTVVQVTFVVQELCPVGMIQTRGLALIEPAATGTTTCLETESPKPWQVRVYVVLAIRGTVVVEPFMRVPTFVLLN
jgi:hypothetical protein